MGQNVVGTIGTPLFVPPATQIVVRRDKATGPASRPATADISAPQEFELTTDENQRLLHIISRSLQIRRHYEIFQLLQNEIQHFLPHQILISAWGDFGTQKLNLDVVSALPGVRTNLPDGCDADVLLRTQYIRWLANGRQPILLNSEGRDWPAESACRCSLHRALGAMETILVHGSQNVRDRCDSLYLLALDRPMLKLESSIERVRVLVEAIVCQIDAAFRRVAVLKDRGGIARRQHKLAALGLSAREVEILLWVSEGRTNADISKRLSISPFTVKNHVSRIMRKLNVANRTAAAAAFHLSSPPASR